jgi:hypothetical protein
MMETLFFVLTVVGVLVVAHWALTNDAAGNRGVTKGLLAMRGVARATGARAARLNRRPAAMRNREPGEAP